MLAVAGLISVPILVLLAVAVCAAIVWTDHGVPVAVGIVSVVLGVVTCALLARVCMALTSLFLRERRSRELSGVFVLVVLVVVVPVGVFLASLEWQGAVPTQLLEAVDALALTPLGAAWALPGVVAVGGDALAARPRRGGDRSSCSACSGPGSSAGCSRRPSGPTSGRARGGLGWFGVAPGTPGGAVAARSLVYWFGDRRYVVNVLVIPFAAAITVVPLLIAGVPPELVALVPVPFAALFLGWLPHNDLAYDSTAVWMHIASGVRGVSDRVGRLVPVLLVGVPLLAVAIPVAIDAARAVGGAAGARRRVHLAVPLRARAVEHLVGGRALRGVAARREPVPAAAAHERGRRASRRASSCSARSSCRRRCCGAAGSLCRDDIDAADMALWGGLAIGLVVLVVGITIGAIVFERRGGRLMEFAEST